MSEINMAAVFALRSIIDSIPKRDETDFCPCCGARVGEIHTRMCEDKANENMWNDFLDKKEINMVEFLYHSVKKGQLQTWSMDLNTAAFFIYKNTPYMLNYGAWGIVCFNLNRAFKASDKTVLGFIPDMQFIEVANFPTAGEQRLMLDLV